jgi:hypothetical protein
LTLLEAHTILAFWIDKYKGSYYAPAELDAILDIGQLALYNDYQPKSSVSQRIKDALSPFIEHYEFTPTTSIGGVVEVPDNYNGHTYLNLLSLNIRYAISGRSLTRRVSPEVTNEDELSDKLASQADPVSSTSPVLTQIGKKKWQLYPEVQYFGTVTYYRRPKKPVYAYTTISGRVEVYDPANSVELEWLETQHTEICLKSLASLGINLGEADVAQFAQIASQNNYMGGNHV